MTTQQSKLTPMLEQYLQIKEQYPDCFLFFRMGDFYELFFEDAEIAARELQIALTSRNPEAEEKVPMCGVPHHSLEEYLRQLLEKNYKTAICEQMEDPRQAKGLVKRGVTRVLTPGTVVEDSGLDSKLSNYLAAIYFDSSKSQGGATWIDFSTGEWSGIFSKNQQEIWQWIFKIGPKELLCPEGLQIPENFSGFRKIITWLPFSGFFDYKRSSELVCETQEVANLTPLDLEDKPQLVQACGAAVQYLRQTQKVELSHLGSFSPLNLNKYLLLDEVTERNLEIFQRLDGKKGPGTLWYVLDHTQTPMGGRLLQTRLRQPWRELKPIQSNQEVLEFFISETELLYNIQGLLDKVFDLERLSTRIHLGRCTPKDFVSLRSSLENLPQIQEVLNRCSDDKAVPGTLQELTKTWDNLEDMHQLLQKSLVDNPPTIITEGGLFKSGYNQELDELLELTEHGEAKLKELLAREQEEQGLPKLKLGYNRVFGYYFELSKASQGPVPEHFHRKQTLVNAERYLTDELKQLEDKIFSSTERRKSLEYELFQELRETVAAARNRIVYMAEIVATLDFWQSLAYTAHIWDWNKPSVKKDLHTSIQEGRHPAVEAVQGRENYIPNDLSLTDNDRILLITGPNMAGKSTVLRQAAIITLLAQMGSFVPAKTAHLGIADRIFSRVGASDNLAYGQSTFMVEMNETARILRQAGKKSLIILDEIGRGTSTFDGLSLAWAVVENLASKGQNGIRSLFATHYHELTELEGHIPGIRNYNIAVKEWKGDIIFLRKMVPGPADRSYGIEVAKLAGIPQSVTQRAKEILAELEQKSETLKIKNKKNKKDTQSLLPGILNQTRGQENSETPGSKTETLLQKLQETDINTLSPLQALNLLQQWKEDYGNAK